MDYVQISKPAVTTNRATTAIFLYRQGRHSGYHIRGAQSNEEDITRK